MAAGSSQGALKGGGIIPSGVRPASPQDWETQAQVNLSNFKHTQSFSRGPALSQQQRRSCSDVKRERGVCPIPHTGSSSWCSLTPGEMCVLHKTTFTEHFLLREERNSEQLRMIFVFQIFRKPLENVCTLTLCPRHPQSSRSWDLAAWKPQLGICKKKCFILSC